MKLNKLAAIPAIALAAGLGLAACGTTVVQPSTGQASGHYTTHQLRPRPQQRLRPRSSSITTTIQHPHPHPHPHQFMCSPRSLHSPP